jgi:RNA polymerase sigma-70 factor (ECF subfamily)
VVSGHAKKDMSARRIGDHPRVVPPHQLDPEAAADHLDRLYRAAVVLCGSAQMAEDLVQETYLKVLARPRLIRHDDDLGYLLKALRNAWYSHLRSRGGQPQEAELPSPERLAAAMGAANPQLSLEAREVLATVAALPEEFREVVVAVDVAGLSYAEAAKALDVAEGTIMSRLSRGRDRVADALAVQEAE